MSDILMTAAQEARAARNAEICARYEQLREQYPDAPQARIFSEIAKSYDILWSQIRFICKKAGVC